MEDLNEIETTQGVEKLNAVESALNKMMGGGFDVESKLNEILGVQQEYDPLERINDILS